MKDFKFIILGVFAILATLALNFRHALNDYGVTGNKLQTEVLAQTSSDGGGDFTIYCSGGDYGLCQYCHRSSIYHPNYGWGYKYDCEMTGDPEDWCPGGCPSNGGGSFPG